MAVLARRYESRQHVPVDLIAQEEHAPLKFLEAILTELRKGGLLQSRRGPSGGYLLARDPKDITIAMVIRILDGPFAPTPCARTRNPTCCEGCDDMERCRLRPFMREARDVMAQVWEHRSVLDLVTGDAIPAELEAHAAL